MGAKELTDFRTLLKRALGNRPFTDAELDSWINDGYYDLTAGVDFPELQEISRATYPASALSISLPSDLQVIRIVSDLTNKKGLLRAGNMDFLLKDADDEAEPEYWSDIGKVLRLWPVPDEDVEVRILYNRYPTALSADDDTTELTPVWDRAVLMMAANHAFLDLNEEARANDWLGRAVTYIRTKLLDQEYEGEGPELGVGVATSISDLTDLKDA